MGYSKKMIDVVALIEQVNAMNAKPDAIWNTRELRHGANNLLETILHGANIYAGYNCYQPSQLPPNTIPGILWNTPDGNYSQGAECTHPDNSRRFYYVSPKLASKGGK